MGHVLKDHIGNGITVSVRAAGIHKESHYYKIIDMPEMPQWVYYNKCACNELDALKNRHYVITDVVPGVMLDTYRSTAEILAARLRNREYRKATFSEVMKDTRKPIRPRYVKAYQNLKSGRVSILSRLARSQAFVKFEKIGQDKWEQGKPARLIQHRSYEYLYLLKSHILPLSKSLVTSSTKLGHITIRDVFAKGKTLSELGQHLQRLWSDFVSPVAVCLDHSKWDGHYNDFLLNTEHSVWNTMSNHNKMLKRLLQLQRKNSGRTHNGLKYTVQASRLSGEYTTSDGNSISNFLILFTIFDGWNNNIRIVVNGDDSVVIMEQSLFKQINFERLFTCFTYFGQDTKIEKIAFNLYDITFCQCSPIEINGLVKMVRDPIRVMSRSCFTDFKWKDLSRYVAALGLCELANNSGVPVLQQYALWLLERSGYKKPVSTLLLWYQQPLENAVIRPITAMSRVQFEQSFGISIPEQLAYEQLFEAKINYAYIEKYGSKFEHGNSMVQPPLFSQSPFNC